MKILVSLFLVASVAGCSHLETADDGGSEKILSTAEMSNSNKMSQLDDEHSGRPDEFVKAYKSARAEANLNIDEVTRDRSLEKKKTSLMLEHGERAVYNLCSAYLNSLSKLSHHSGSAQGVVAALTALTGGLLGVAGSGGDALTTLAIVSGTTLGGLELYQTRYTLGPDPEEIRNLILSRMAVLRADLGLSTYNDSYTFAEGEKLLIEYARGCDKSNIRNEINLALKATADNTNAKKSAQDNSDDLYCKAILLGKFENAALNAANSDAVQGQEVTNERDKVSAEAKAMLEKMGGNLRRGIGTNRTKTALVNCGAKAEEILFPDLAKKKKEKAVSDAVEAAVSAAPADTE